MNPARPVAQAIAVRGERIMAVGSNRVVLRLRSRGTRVVDLRGRTVMPGFNDSHGHWIGDREGPLPGSSAQDAIAEALSRGWTSISELFVNEDRLTELRGLDAAGELRLRVNGYLPVNFHEDKFGLWFDGAYTPRQEFSDRLRIAGAKVFADRAAPSAMLLSEPHSDNPGYLGEDYWTQQELTDVVTELDDKGWQVAIHTAGDGAHDRVLNAFASALAGDPNRLRHRIEHAMVVRDDQIRRIRQLGLIASIQLTFFQSDWLTGAFWTGFEPALGPARIGWAGRWRDLLDAGVHVIGSTDTPWFAEDWVLGSPLESVEMAVTRIGRNGTQPAPWMLAQRITRLQALRLLTRDAAYGTLDEARKGTVTPGKWADLVILGRNPLAVPPTQISEIPVLTTMVGGSVEFCAPVAAALCS
jgi:predicted amidohydrolase YtcJ